jgi:hypothetical protein
VQSPTAGAAAYFAVSTAAAVYRTVGVAAGGECPGTHCEYHRVAVHVVPSERKGLEPGNRMSGYGLSTRSEHVANSCDERARLHK